MRRWIALLAALAAPAAAARTSGTADAVVRVGPGGATVEYRLDRPTTRFVFAGAEVERHPEMTVATPGLTLADDAITAAVPFRRFTIRIAPTAAERDARYPLLTAIGSGGVLHVPALRGADGGWRTRITFRLAPGQIRLPADGKATYVGPASLAADERGFTVVTDPAMPAWLRARSVGDLAAALRFFTGALGASLPTRPLLVLRHFDDGGTSFVGDVAAGPTAVLRFHGTPWAVESAQGIARIRSFVFHEVFHFWNGGLVGNAAGTPAWLHEGGADYAALLAERETGAIDDAAVADRIGHALTRCRSALGARSMASFDTLPQAVRYPCGLAVQWLVDAAMRRASGGERTVLSAWGDTIRRAAAMPEARYSLTDFYAATALPGIAREAAISLIVDGTGSGRWDDLPALLRRMGLSARAEVTPDGRMPAVLMHLLAENCGTVPKGSAYGFFGGDPIRLQTPAGCGVLAGDPSILRVMDEPPAAISAAGFDAITAACASGRGVPLTTSTGGTILARCARPLRSPDPGFVVESWRPDAGAIRG